MCGIFGVLEHNLQSTPDPGKLAASAKLLAHRGPDHCGIYNQPGIGLAHTRLSLLDLAARSNQPFWDGSQRYGIVYNGEIYNFKELRADLERQGVRFKTTSDTEVLIESIVHCGLESTLPRLEGMYAFALHDKEDRSLTLVRDRFGIKPLYMYEDATSFIFSSEIRAFLPWRTFELDTMRAAGYLLDWGTFTRGFTLMKDVKMLAPGTVVTVRPGEAAQTRRFFSLSDLWDEDQQAELNPLRPGAIVDKVEAALLAAVGMQQFADATVGALCSGGVDSSLTVAMASRIQPNIQIFHAHTPGKTSELSHASAIASHLHLDLNTVTLDDQDHVDLIPETILHRGNPFIDLHTSIPFLKLSRLVQSHGVKGVLTGEASDECFWGFPRMIPNFADAVPRLSNRLHEAVASGMGRLFGGKTFRKTRGNLAFGASLLARFEVDLEADEIKHAVLAKSHDSINRRDFQTLMELNFNLRPLLNRNDACGMAAGMESRFPFLDYNLVKLAVNLPRRHKARFSLATLNPAHPFMVDKWVLRKVADRYMPRALSRRYKVAWPSSAHNRLEMSRGFFENSFVRDLFEFSHKELNYLMGHAEQIQKLKLLHLEVWAQMFLNGSSPDQMVQQLQTGVSIRPEAN